MPETTRKHIVIGTAGHIDHGKSALIKSLTGTDPDRLKEEKERGMTTDLGFAFYRDDVTIIDVPGHEKFVRHMLAGASNIDFVMFVIAADDGIMPQTLEHFEILKLLEIKKGVIVVTKIDLVPVDHRAMVIEDIKNLVKESFLNNAPIIPVSNSTNEGIEELKRTLDRLIEEIEAKKDQGIFHMPIDRCFTIKGFGTVVAGTILSGRISVGDTIEILPSKKRVKIRGIEVHNEKVSEAGTGFRAAVNIAGAEKDEIERGDVLAQPGYFEPSHYMNASFYLLSSADKSLRNLTRLRIHLGTKEVLGRVLILDKKIVEPGQKAMVQFRLEMPAVATVGDHYVVRTYSPQATIGGGAIIEPKAEKVKGFDEQLIEHLQKIEAREPKIMIEENLVSNFELPRKPAEIARDLNLVVSDVENIIKELVSEKKVILVDANRGLYYAQQNIETFKNNTVNILSEYHKKNPTHIGMPRIELATNISRGMDHSLFNFLLEKMVAEKLARITSDNRICLFDFQVVIDKNLRDIVEKIEQIYQNAEYQPPVYEELLAKRLGPDDLVKKAHRYLIDTGLLVFLGEGITMHQRMVKQAKEKLLKFFETKEEMKVSEFRDLLGNTSRKYALPLLIYFDTHKITIKRGDVRIKGQD